MSLKVEPDTLSALSLASSTWNLRTLVIYLGTGTVKGFFERNHDDVLQNLDVARLSHHLRRLELRVVAETEIVNDMARNGFASVSRLLAGKVSSFPLLERLVLTCPIIVDGDHDLRLSPTLTRSLLSLVPSLQHLQISAFNLSDDVLHQLSQPVAQGARQQKLCTLTVDVFAFNVDARLPELSPSAWGKLLKSCPDLQVTCLVRCPLTKHHLKIILPPSVPLVSLRVDCNRGQTVSELLQALEIARQHTGTLHTFENYFTETTEECEKLLVSLVTECSQLHSLVYMGNIDHRHVKQFAALEKRWQSFMFCKRYIVLGTTDDNQEMMMRSKEREEETRAKLNELCSVVSGHLDRPWAPDDRY